MSQSLRPTYAATDIREALQQDGHRIWGFVVYRCTYKSDADWDEFMRRLRWCTRRNLEFYQGLDLMDSLGLTVLEDRSRFGGASTSTIRDHFIQWAETAVKAEQGAGARARGSQRYRYCIQVDEEALDSVVHKAPAPWGEIRVNNVGYVNLVSKEWEPYDPVEYEDEDERLEEPPEEPVEGCTLHDVGWMKVLYDRVMVSKYNYLRDDMAWEYEYRRPPLKAKMKYQNLLTVVASCIASTSAVSVSGAAEGFAKGVTGGGSATAVYPTTTDELVSYLGDSQTRVIVLTKTFDFTGTEGTTTATGCAPWGTASACQLAINQNNWCTNYEPDAPSVSVTYDNAGVLGITVNSNKSLLGSGSSGVIKGKGLRIVSGASNIIIQNVAITDINPKYVWGGDAITIDDADMVWIDHVTTARVGRQHLVLGTSASNRVTISNNYFNGVTSYSATCDGYTYWGIYLDGSNDLVTMKGNYIYHFSGRSPKVQGNTLLHAVNNYWYDSSGHAFEIGSGGYVLAEGNVFQNIDTVVESPVDGQLFTSPDATTNKVCSTYLGHVCQVNGFGSSGTFSQADEGFLANFEGKNIASASAYTVAQSSVPSSAGQGKI